MFKKRSIVIFFLMTMAIPSLFVFSRENHKTKLFHNIMSLAAPTPAYSSLFVNSAPQPAVNHPEAGLSAFSIGLLDVDSSSLDSYRFFDNPIFRQTQNALIPENAIVHGRSAQGHVSRLC
jgi:hypothetical protein